jgi:hypothetical protein
MHVRRHSRARARRIAAVIAATCASVAFAHAPAEARGGGASAGSYLQAAPVADKATGSGKHRAHGGGGHAHSGNKGGQERGLNRADSTAGSHGDRGRDQAAANGRRR